MFNIVIKKEFLSKEECKEILDFSLKNLQLEEAKVGWAEQRMIRTHIRKSYITLHDYSKEFPIFFNKLVKLIDENVSVKGHELDYNMKFQFTRYNTGDYYVWHNDEVPGLRSTEYFCSFVIHLNDDYEGGQLEIVDDNQNTISLEQGIGNLIIFPSESLHRVVEVTKNTRYSLVGWFKLKSKKEYNKTII